MAQKKVVAKPRTRARKTLAAEDDPFLTDVIATRDYQLPTGARVRVVIRKPEPAPEGDWRCAFEVTGIEQPFAGTSSASTASRRSSVR